MYKAETIKYRGYNIDIFVDDTPGDPREWDSPFIMTCGHNSYILGDEQWKPEHRGEYAMYAYFHGMSGLYPELDTYELEEDELRRISEWVDQEILWLPLYLYDHSGITMRTSAFSCPWDSGMVGFIWISRKDARKYWSWGRITKAREKDVYKWMNGDVETYDHYLRGDVYGYMVDDTNGEHIDSCWGFYGTDWEENGLLEHAKSVVDFYIEKIQKAHNTRTKTLIKNGVSLEHRQLELQSL